MAVSANKRLEYLERGIVELERKFLKIIDDCQNAKGNEGGHLARAYLLLGLRELGKLFDGAKDAESGEGPSGTKYIGVSLSLYKMGPPPTPPLSPVKNKNKGKMEDLNNVRKENSSERVEATNGHGTQVPKESASQFEQKLLKFQEELDQMIESHKFSDIIKLGERIEEGIKSGMVTNFKALQATNKALQSGGVSKKKGREGQKKEYVEFLKVYEDIFAWSYNDMTGLSTSIVAYKLPTNPTCLSVKQKLRKFKLDMTLKIKEEVTKQVKAKVLRVVEYPTWLAKIFPVPMKDGKVRVCVDYRDLNQASPKDDFPLPNIHILIDNCAKHELQSFIDCFAGYHQI
ncbi:uncharacterized protein [Nicotiana sylvestris]|uniref:uncharacterized protein n=1 Tax=Nicotiana sylvestris TaxID=4096 RepID=UPI00388C3EB9